MRVISGLWRHRLLKRPPESTTRPTTDRVKEALFNILVHGLSFDFEHKKVLDLFAGSGALGIEALSRGADFSYFCEENKTAQSVLIENLSTLGSQDQWHVFIKNAFDLPIAASPVDLVFLDPPYHQEFVEKSLTFLMKQRWLTLGTLVVAEVATTEKITIPPGFDVLSERIYGKSRLIFIVSRV